MNRRTILGALVAGALVALLGSAPALAAPAHSASPTASKVATGADVSWPQCGKRLPAGQAFGLVGVNGGSAADFNGCLAAEAAWAASTSGTTAQPTTAFYINTANPGSLGSWWPTSDSSQPPAGAYPAPVDPLPAAAVTYPDGTPAGCTTTAFGTPSYSRACAYVYGYVRAEQAVEWAVEQIDGFDPSAYRWWLDVETSNTWQNDTSANAASLAGAASYLQQVGLGVGVYSTTAQWAAIVGGTRSNIPPLPNGQSSNLIGLDEWGAGAASLKGAQSNCAATSFTGGKNRLMQYIAGGADYDVSCGGY